MLRKVWLTIPLVAFLPVVAIAQTPADNNKPAEAQTPSSPDSSGPNMRPVAVGDHWTYQVRDNLSGDLKGQYTQTVTDAGSKDISTRVLALGAASPSFIVFDPLWNVKSTAVAKFEPNDGTGVKDSMKPHDSWTTQTSDNRASQTLWKRTATSKVVGEESVTTDAGTFNAIKYETTIDIRGAIDPTKKANVVVTTWWVPSINHWVKRTEKGVSENQVKSNSTIELVDYGRQ